MKGLYIYEKNTMDVRRNTYISSTVYREMPADIVTPIDFTTKMKVNEQMPEFTVHITGNNSKSYTDSDEENTYYILFDDNHIENMIITDDNGILMDT